MSLVEKNLKGYTEANTKIIFFWQLHSGQSWSVPEVNLPIICSKKLCTGRSSKRTSCFILPKKRIESVPNCCFAWNNISTVPLSLFSGTWSKHPTQCLTGKSECWKTHAVFMESLPLKLQTCLTLLCCKYRHLCALSTVQAVSCIRWGNSIRFCTERQVEDCDKCTDHMQLMPYERFSRQMSSYKSFWSGIVRDILQILSCNSGVQYIFRLLRGSHLLLECVFIVFFLRFVRIIDFREYWL